MGAVITNSKILDDHFKFQQLGKEVYTVLLFQFTVTVNAADS